MDKFVTLKIAAQLYPFIIINNSFLKLYFLNKSFNLYYTFKELYYLN